MKIEEIDFNDVWQCSMGWRSDVQTGRKFDDAEERAFWENLVSRYTTLYDLNRDTPLIAERMKEKIGLGKSVLEIGCGSGNFTMKMAEYSRSVLGLDFSPAMLRELAGRTAASGYTHVRSEEGKWEDFETEERFDAVVSVNSLYRVRDMEAALLKMCRYAGIVLIVRTIQRSVLYPLYQTLGISADECRDYRIFPEIFWQHGILADVEFLTYPVIRRFPSMEAVREMMAGDLGEVFAKAEPALMTEAARRRVPSEEGVALALTRTTVIISARG